MGDGAGARRGGKGRSSAGRLRGRPGQVGSRAAEARSGPNGFGAPPVTRRTLGAEVAAHSQTRAGLGVCALAGGGLQVSVLSTALFLQCRLYGPAELSRLLAGQTAETNGIQCIILHKVRYGEV